MLSAAQTGQFIRDGYLILPKAASPEQVAQLRAQTEAELGARNAPFELEATVQYPGAPVSQNAQGGDTIRRLLQAYDRHPLYQRWANNPAITTAIQQLLRSQQVLLSPNHHNCIMTKQPAFSSQTGWHRDTRYWQFNNKYLINSWLALGEETAENGGMLILPGSHRWDVAADSLDEAQFLKADHPGNAARLSLARQLDLQPGDCLLFSAHCFHAAGANTTEQQKFSLVFTYHSERTHGLPDTPSSRAGSIPMSF